MSFFSLRFAPAELTYGSLGSSPNDPASPGSVGITRSGIAMIVVSIIIFVCTFGFISAVGGSNRPSIGVWLRSDAPARLSLAKAPCLAK